jgi:hypothetical protein
MSPSEQLLGVYNKHCVTPRLLVVQSTHRPTFQHHTDVTAAIRGVLCACLQVRECTWFTSHRPTKAQWYLALLEGDVVHDHSSKRAGGICTESLAEKLPLQHATDHKHMTATLKQCVIACPMQCTLTE